MTLRERYQKEIAPTLQKELILKNPLSVPRVTSITVAVGLSKGLKDARFMETAEQTLTRITGQKPVQTKAKKSIAGFKIREGMVVGMRVTLRGERMWSFLERLLTVTFPRVRDFRGISTKLVDTSGNITIGFHEFLPFPEISPDEVERIHGLQVTVSTTAKNRESGIALFRSLGFPFND